MKTPKRLLLELIDAYIIRYHSDRYIDRELIQPEIAKRITEAVRVNDTIRDEQEHSKLEAQKLDYEIKEKGWCAEIDNMHSEMQKVFKMREEVLTLRFQVYQWAKRLAMITAENKYEGNTIIQAVASSVGKLDKIGANAADIVLEMDTNENKDMDALRIR